MCYLIRHQQAAAETSPAATPPRPGQLQPRWVGAAAFALIGGLAVAAAFVTQPPTPQAKELAAVAPVQSNAVQPSSLERASLQSSNAMPPNSLAPDDDVPAASGNAKAAFGHCEHDL